MVRSGFEWPNDAEYTRLLAVHGEALARLAYLLTGNRADAEDAVQDAVISVAARWTAMSKESPLGYLRTAVARRALDIAHRRRSLPLEAALDLGSPESGYLLTEGSIEFVRMLQGLPERQKAVLVLRYHQQLDDREIARILGCTTATVRSQASRGLAKLRAATGQPDASAPIPGGELSGSGSSS